MKNDIEFKFLVVYLKTFFQEHLEDRSFFYHLIYRTNSSIT